MNHFIKLGITGLFLIFSLRAHSQQDTIVENSSTFSIKDINSKDYGKGGSIGFNILGDGLGVITRYRLKSEDQIGLSVNFWGVAEYDQNGVEIKKIHPGVFLRSEYNFFLGDTYKEKHKAGKIKKKYKKHYLSLKAGVGFSIVKLYSVGLTWHKEMFFLEKNNFSKGIDLGLVYYFSKDSNLDIIYNGAQLFLRFDWNWFRNENR